MRLCGNVSANSANFPMRSSIMGRRRRAQPAVATNLRGSRNIRPAAASSPRCGSHSSTGDDECDTRITVRKITGSSNCSLSASATPTKSLASWLSAGSSIGILASRA